MYVCSKALRHAVAFGFTETGIVPFKESPDIIIPYEFMSKDQLAVALSECRRIEESCMYVCSTKMKTGFFVSAMNEDKHYICKHAILTAVESLLRKQAVESESVQLIIHQLIGDCVFTSAPAATATSAQEKGDVAVPRGMASPI